MKKEKIPLAKDEKASRRRHVVSLFLTFMKIGAFTFGGGYAMIPLIQREICQNKKWLTDSELLDVIAISESTPGPISVNAATFIGYKVAGMAGAFSATLGVILPSFLIIYAISFVLRQFEELTAVKYAFFGVRAGVLALVVRALVTLYKQCEKGLFAYILMGLAFAAVVFLNVNAVWIILACGVVGFVSVFVAKRKGGAA